MKTKWTHKKGPRHRKDDDFVEDDESSGVYSVYLDREIDDGSSGVLSMSEEDDDDDIADN